MKSCWYVTKDHTGRTYVLARTDEVAVIRQMKLRQLGSRIAMHLPWFLESHVAMNRQVVSDKKCLQNKMNASFFLPRSITVYVRKAVEQKFRTNHWNTEIIFWQKAFQHEPFYWFQDVLAWFGEQGPSFSDVVFVERGLYFRAVVQLMDTCNIASMMLQWRRTSISKYWQNIQFYFGISNFGTRRKGLRLAARLCRFYTGRDC